MAKEFEKSGPVTSNKLGSISNLLSIIGGAFSLGQKPVTPLPPPLVLTGAKLRVGLSAKEIASRIISRQSESDAPVGDIFESSDNISEKMELIRVEEIVSALLTEAKIEIAIPPGIGVSTIGIGNQGAPVISRGSSTNITTGSGVIR